VSWPPEIGAPLPRVKDAYGVREKLAGYSLKTGHEDGGPKAAAFSRILGINSADLEYLADAILAGVQRCPVVEVRDAGEYGMHCQVIVRVHGLGACAERVANVLTAWQLRWDGDAPRWVTAFITSKVVR
jgi:hypothetical protein